MMRCEDIKRTIDEADRPDLFPLEAANHLEACADCSSFAQERARLRSLLASGVRVSVPANFNAVLNERIVAAKQRSLAAWFGSLGYMKLGAATAGLAVTFFAVQYAGFFSERAERPTGKTASGGPSVESPSPSLPSFTADQPVILGPGRQNSNVLAVVSKLRNRRQPIAIEPASNSDFNERGALLVRRPNSDHDILVPTVNVGAQQLVYSNAGTPARRVVGTSF